MQLPSATNDGLTLGLIQFRARADSAVAPSVKTVSARGSGTADRARVARAQNFTALENGIAPPSFTYFKFFLSILAYALAAPVLHRPAHIQASVGRV